MNYLLTFLIFGVCFVAMAIGLIFAKKVLQKGCSLGPECTCRDEGKSPQDCDNPNK